ncbi:acyltransferase [Stenotrophomonas lactitubi]|uniref:acyltransferase n=1 Tax=Stenotrophomonas lactitubi TaxID=2045214 RepID=UPI001DFFFDBC|nr:acyltransferase [Stenotrophomonas lactitubi]CAH0221927.1 Putative acetyltransferase Rv3034c [Stenotrophomonas lactitubi]
MHRLYKIAWVVRALIFKLMFKSFVMPGYLGRPTFILGAARMSLGTKVRIFPGMRAECFEGGALQIGDDVSIGQNFHIICSSELSIGSGCLISSSVFITDTDHQYDDVSLPVSSQPVTIRPTRIGDNCFIGVGARIQAGTVLGKGCIVGANAVVRGEFPDHCVIAGMPARIIKRYDHQAASWLRV